MKYTKIKRVYNCCGQYLAVANNYAATIKCPRCGQELTEAVTLPTIQYVTAK